MIKDLKNCDRDETGLPVVCSRQYELREELELRSDRWTKGEDLYAAMLERGFTYYGRDPKKAYKKINDDVRFLNVCGRFDKMILGDRAKGYKMATEKEFSEWARKKHDEMVGGLEYLGILCKNAKLDGNAILNIFSQPYIRDHKECFVKEGEGNADAEKPD